MLAPGLRVVFCGTALGHESARRQAYYAHPGNAFWKALHRLGFTDRLLAPEEYPRALDYGIGLTDLCKIYSGNDRELPEGCFDAEALRQKIESHKPRYLAFTSKTAASGYLGRKIGKETPYGLLKETIGETKLFMLSSPSGQARSSWCEAAWMELARKVRHENV